MAIQSELERYEEWRSTFTLSEDGPHVFLQLDKLREIDTYIWNSDGTAEEKVDHVSRILSR